MKKELKKFLLVCPLALLTLLVPSFLQETSALTPILLLAIAICMLAIDWSAKNIIYYLAVFISGPIAESIAIYFGVWSYAHPVFIGIPLWLPFVWGNAGIYVLRLKALIDSFKK